MPYEVTATKFRPQNFDDVVGQEFITTTLKNSISNSRIANAYLLSGPRGCGKTSTARIIAKSLNCINGPTASPCNHCEQCNSITNGNHTDVIEIDGASNTGINEIRKIQEEILYPPVTSKYKIYIIDEVHMLTKHAFNALLKTIEEPPERVVFIFATTEINKVLPTIRSRCQQFNLRLIPSDLIFLSLKNILNKQNITFTDEAINWISIEGKGSMRDSYTLLDQIISFCDGHITLDKIQQKLGLLSEEKLINLIMHITKDSSEKLLSELFSLIDSGISPEQILSDLIKYINFLYFKKINIQSIFIFNQNDPRIIEFLHFFTKDDFETIMNILFETYEKTRYSSDIQLDLQICFVKLLKFKQMIRPKKILEELYLLKESLFSGQSFNPVNNPVNSINQIKPKDKLTVDIGKSEILRILKNSIPPSSLELINALNNISKIEETSDKMIITFSHKLYYDLTIKNHELIKHKISEIVGHEYEVEIVLVMEQKNTSRISDINASRIKEIFNGKEIF